MSKRIMFFVLLVFSVAACGGGGGEGDGGDEIVNLLGDWHQVYTRTECGTTEFLRLTTFFSLDGDISFIGTMRDQGEFPRVLGDGQCSMSSLSVDRDFSPYPANQNAAQFEEMFNLKSGWVFKTLTVTEFTENRITMVREFDDGRAVTYVFTR